MDNKLYDDEWRLLQFFRCLSLSEQSDVLITVGSQAMKNCLPDKSIYELIPEYPAFMTVRHDVNNTRFCFHEVIEIEELLTLSKTDATRASGRANQSDRSCKRIAEKLCGTNENSPYFYELRQFTRLGGSENETELLLL